MHMQAHAHAAHEHHHDGDSTDVLGFWLYIMTDCILFASLFAVYVVLAQTQLDGPTLKEMTDLNYVLIETFCLLASNFTFCLAALAMNGNHVGKVQFWLLLTFILGACFVGMEVHEFYKMSLEGFRWDLNAHASSFFTLVGTHGLHVSIGLIWILFMIIQLPILGISSVSKRRLTYLGLFWNFLDIVWIFVFSIVYLMGAL